MKNYTNIKEYLQTQIRLEGADWIDSKACDACIARFSAEIDNWDQMEPWQQIAALEVETRSQSMVSALKLLVGLFRAIFQAEESSDRTDPTMLRGQSDSEPLIGTLREVESRLASLGLSNARLTKDTTLPPNLEGLPPLVSDSVTTLLPSLFPEPVTTSPWTELKILSDSFCDIWTSICAKFIQYPPSELEAREHQCKKLTETVLAEIILGVDAIETRDNREAGLIKRKIIIYATEAVRRCNQVVSSTATRESRPAQAEDPVLDDSGLDAEHYVRQLHLIQLEEERLRP